MGGFKCMGVGLLGLPEREAGPERETISFSLSGGFLRDFVMRISFTMILYFY